VVDDPVETLKLFFAIPKEQISRDLIAATEDEQPFILAATQRYLAVPPNKERAPKVVADFWHAQMLRACLMRKNPNIPEGMALYWASYNAHDVADAACDVASAAGQLAKFHRDMDRMETEEGLEEGEYWPLGNGPEEYELLRTESEALVDKITDTMIVHVLRRYGLNDEADLFESHRAAFDAKAEAGRKRMTEES